MGISRRYSRRSLARWFTAATVQHELPLRLLAAADRTIIHVGGGTIDVDFTSQAFGLPRRAILDWVQRSATAVSIWLGAFAMRRAKLQIELADADRGVGPGTSWGDDGARCRVSIGRHATSNDLDRDWVLTHELLHFAFPSVPRRHHWIEEGHRDICGAARACRHRAADSRPGLERHDSGYAPRSSATGRSGARADSYLGQDVLGWGFCLLADIGIRKATGNHSGLREALKGINNTGGNITVEWPLMQVLDVGDRSTGTTVLSDLHRQMGQLPIPVDLPALWAQLGVKRTGDRVTFDDRAPLAKIRASMIVEVPSRRPIKNG